MTAAQTVLTQFGFAHGWRMAEAMAFPRPVATTGSVRPLDEVEKEYILAALRLNGGNQTRTAEQLRIGSATLYRRLKSYGLIGGRRGVRKGARRRGASSSSP